MTCGARPLPKSVVQPFGSIKTPGRETVQGFLFLAYNRTTVVIMNIHKLQPDRALPDSGAHAVGLNLNHRIYGFADSVLKTRALRSLENIAAKYPIYRLARCASARKL